MFIILQIFFETRAVLKTGQHHSDIPQFYIEHIQSREAFRLIASERKLLINYNSKFHHAYLWLVFRTYRDATYHTESHPKNQTFD